MLSIASGEEWSAVTHILSTRRERKVPLDAERLESLWGSAGRLERLAAQTEAPAARNIPLCATCSFALFCGFA
jgi:CRISPR-associated exonuclease Cas4